MAKKKPETSDASASPIDPANYPHQVPRYIHHAEQGAKLVQTAEECEAHLQDGWHLQPPQAVADSTDDETV